MKSDRRRWMFGGTAALAAGLLATSVQAQETGAPAPEQSQPEAADEAAAQEIIVTGTNLRGVAPVGTNVVSFGQQQIQASGATSTNDVLARIPQITSNFNRINPSSPGQGYGVTSSTPNIRNIGGSIGAQVTAGVALAVTGAAGYTAVFGILALVGLAAVPVTLLLARAVRP